MKILRERFDDRSEPDEDGMYDYIYVGTVYSFEDNERRIRFRLYDDEPGIAGVTDPIAWSPEIYTSDMFRSAVDYLRLHESVDTIHVCDPTPPGRGFIAINEAVKLARRKGLPVPQGFCD